MAGFGGVDLEQPRVAVRSRARSGSLALAALAGVCLLPGSRVGSGRLASPGFAAPPANYMQAPLRGAAARTAAPATAASPAPFAATSFAMRAAAGAATLAAFFGAGRRSAAAPKPRVATCAISPFPSAPASDQGKRRIRAGPHRAFLRGRQVSVRVNPKTNKPIRYRMHVQPGDTVQVVKGKDAGKVTTVLRVFPKWNKVICLGVNYCIKHVRPRREDDVGQRVQVEAPLHASGLMHYSEKEGIAGLLGIKYVEIDGVLCKRRYNKATGEIIKRKKGLKWRPVLERESGDDDSK